MIPERNLQGYQRPIRENPKRPYSREPLPWKKSVRGYETNNKQKELEPPGGRPLHKKTHHKEANTLRPANREIPSKLEPGRFFGARFFEKKGAEMYLLKGFLIFCLLLFCPLDGFSKMYKWVDKDGKVHFTDQGPPEEATEVKEYGEDGTKNEPKQEAKKETGESEDGLTLKDVDLITTWGFYKNGVLEIYIHGRNRATDKLIWWKEGTMECKCEIYEDVGKRRQRKGNKIASITQEVMSGSQHIYVDAPENYFKDGKKVIIECLFDTGYRKLKATSNPSFGYKKHSPGGTVRGGATSQTLN